MTDAKLPDFQAGYEKSIPELFSALAGANLIYEAAGMYGSLLAASKESFVLDNDLIGSVLRASRGIEISTDAPAFDVIRAVFLDGPGHFLGSGQTLGRTESDYYYPATADRDTPQAWADAGTRPLLERARETTRTILTGYPTPIFGDEIANAICKRFPEIVL